MVHRDVYNIVTVENGNADNKSILKVFTEMAAGRIKSDIKLLNYFHEIPISYSATINNVEDDSIELSVNHHQALIIKQDKFTLIKSKHFHKDYGVHCYANYINVPKSIVILNNFAYAVIRAERREAVRVNVEKCRIHVGFTFENVTLEGTMLDISGSGALVFASVLPSTPNEQPGSLAFAIMGTQLTVPAIFLKASETKDGNICVFTFNLDRRSDNIVAQFIYQRQVEIIQDLKDDIV